MFPASSWKFASAAVLAALLLLPGAATAQEPREGTIGLGAVTQFGGGFIGARPTQLSAKFRVQPRLEISGLLGLSFGSNQQIFVPGTKFQWVLLQERNLNLYGAIAAGVDLRTGSGLESFFYQVGPGIEFFFSDWPNVGFSLEIGFGGNIVSNGTTVGAATNQTGFGQAGIHYYF